MDWWGRISMAELDYKMLDAQVEVLIDIGRKALFSFEKGKGSRLTDDERYIFMTSFFTGICYDRFSQEEQEYMLDNFLGNK
jgi:hypothetical protein